MYLNAASYILEVDHNVIFILDHMMARHTVSVNLMVLV